MGAYWVPIVVAIITGPVVVLLQKVRKENTSQHTEGRILLRVIGHKVDKIGTKIDSHIGWHEGIRDAVEKEELN